MPHDNTTAPKIERAAALKAILDAVEIIAHHDNARTREYFIKTALEHFHLGDYGNVLAQARRIQLAVTDQRRA